MFTFDGLFALLLFSRNFNEKLTMARELQENGCYVALTDDCLDAKSMMDRVRSPQAGAIVLFAGIIQFLALQFSSP